MIIKSTRLRTVYGSKQTRNHICRGEDNLEVRVIQGDESWIDEAFAYAASHGREYAVRHVIIAPEADTSIEEMVEEARRYAVEFGLEFDDAFLVAHHKPRIRDACEWHLHALFRDFNILTGAASDNRNNFRRQEKLAREAEHRLGHAFVQGAHTRWVIGQLFKEGKVDVATSLQAAFPGEVPRPKASLDPATIQKLKRQGLSASALRQHVRNAWHGSTTARDFLDRVAACGMSITVGEREPPSWIVTVSGNFLCSLAGALPGVRIITINQRLGDPTNVRKADAVQPVPHRPANLADSAADSRTPAATDNGRNGGDHPGGARPDDGRPAEANRAGPGDPARVAGDGNRLHHGSPGLEVGAGSFAPQELTALRQQKHAIADILSIANRVAELPYARIVRALERMERAALNDVDSANVATPEGLAEAKDRLGQLIANREKTTRELRERESDLTMLQAHVPSWWERVSGSYTARIKNAEEARERAKTADEDAQANQKRQAEWLGLLATAHERRVGAAAPIAEKAAHNLRIVQQARYMLTTDPRLASIGPFAFIAEAARRADYRRPSYSSSAEKDRPLPNGDDARTQVNMWNIPLRFG